MSRSSAILFVGLTLVRPCLAAPLHSEVERYDPSLRAAALERLVRADSDPRVLAVWQVVRDRGPALLLDESLRQVFRVAALEPYLYPSAVQGKILAARTALDGRGAGVLLEDQELRRSFLYLDRKAQVFDRLADALQEVAASPGRSEGVGPAATCQRTLGVLGVAARFLTDGDRRALSAPNRDALGMLISRGLLPYLPEACPSKGGSYELDTRREPPEFTCSVHGDRSGLHPDSENPGRGPGAVVARGRALEVPVGAM